MFRSDPLGRLVKMPSHREATRRAILDRRLSPRVELLSNLHGQLVAVDVALVIREASEGGFSVESPVRFPVGSKQVFRLCADSGESTVVLTRCRHSMRVNLPDEPSFSISGFEFLPQPEENLRLVRETIRAIV